jgi:hypothetical protein
MVISIPRLGTLLGQFSNIARQYSPVVNVHLLVIKLSQRRLTQRRKDAKSSIHPKFLKLMFLQ